MFNSPGLPRNPLLLEFVLVCSGWYDNSAINWADYKQFSVWQARKFSIMGLADSVSGEGPLFSWWLSSVSSHGRRRDKGTLQGFCPESTNPVCEASTFLTQAPSRGRITLGLRFPPVKFGWGHTHSVNPRVQLKKISCALPDPYSSVCANPVYNLLALYFIIFICLFSVFIMFIMFQM